MRRGLALLAVAVAGLGAPVGPGAQAQEAPADTVVVPAPVEGGVLYYRAGTPGGVRIRSGRRPAARRATDALTAEDLAALEDRLLRALDARLAEVVRGMPAGSLSGTGGAGRAPADRPVIVLPGGAAPGVVGLPAGRPADAPPAEVPAVQPRVGIPFDPLRPVPRAALRDLDAPVTAAEVERVILETGLFRTTTVHFAFARAELLDASFSVLDVVGSVLARYPALVVSVDGHTDSVGSDAVNDPLSVRRAESVRQYLLASFPEIDPARLLARGFGQRQPIASNATDVGRTLNRRVEFVVLAGAGGTGAGD